MSRYYDWYESVTPEEYPERRTEREIDEDSERADRENDAAAVCEECHGTRWLERKEDSAPVECWACCPHPTKSRWLHKPMTRAELDAAIAGMPVPQLGKRQAD